MTASKAKFYDVGANLCKFALVVITLCLMGQGLDNLFYTGTYARLFYLCTAFILVFPLCLMLRAMARQIERRSRYQYAAYRSAIAAKAR